MAKRIHHRYVLRDGSKIVQYGITDDLERREEEHKRNGKRFTSILPAGPAVTEDSAEKWEEEILESYRRHHDGRNPRYNKTKR